MIGVDQKSIRNAFKWRASFVFTGICVFLIRSSDAHSRRQVNRLNLEKRPQKSKCGFAKNLQHPGLCGEEKSDAKYYILFFSPKQMAPGSFLSHVDKHACFVSTPTRRVATNWLHDCGSA